MNTSIMQRSGRVTVPAGVRRVLATGPGARLRWEMHDTGAVRVKITRPVTSEVLINHDENCVAPRVELREAKP